MKQVLTHIHIIVNQVVYSKPANFNNNIILTIQTNGECDKKVKRVMADCDAVSPDCPVVCVCVWTEMLLWHQTESSSLYPYISITTSSYTLAMCDGVWLGAVARKACWWACGMERSVQSPPTSSRNMRDLASFSRTRNSRSLCTVCGVKTGNDNHIQLYNALPSS